jgi:GT2 family glycosyltransferase
MVRREVFEQVGLLVDAYFLYFEETDLLRRAARAGWECWTVPDSRVVHLAGQSTGIPRGKAAARPMPPYWYASRRRYFRKHHGPVRAALADAAWLGGYALNMTRHAVTFSLDQAPPSVLAAFLQHRSHHATGRPA